LNPENREAKNRFIDQTVLAMSIEESEEIDAFSEIEEILLQYSLRDVGMLSTYSDSFIDRMSRKLRVIFGSRSRSFIVSILPRSLKSFIGYELRKVREVGIDLSKLGIKVDHAALSKIETTVMVPKNN
jgi:hypothetical protein